MASSVGSASNTASSAAAGASAAAKSTFGSNFDTFLKILTTQLQHQDPTSPMDTTTFTTQLVQFSQVEQSIRQNTNLETLIQMQQNSQAANAVNYIGKTVEMSNDTVGLVNGEGTITYTLPQQAARTIISIYNQSGSLVAQQEGENDQGDHVFKWNGASNSGTKMTDGTYYVTVSAQDAAGKSIDTTGRVIGEVSKVDYTGGTVLLTVNGLQLPLAQLATVRGSALGT